MSEQVNIGEAEAQFSQLIARVEQGDEIIITRAGKPVACLHPIRDARAARVPGSAKGKIILNGDFNEALPEELLKEFER